MLTKEEREKIKKLLGASIKGDFELRTNKVELRVKRKDDGALPRIEGYAAVFNSDSEDMGFVERIKPGAFKKALKISDARALFNHDPNYVLGRQSAGTLELKEDKNGLFMSVQPPDTQLIRDLVLTPIERGDINDQSFGFTIAADEWEGLDTDHPVRTITEVREVFDVSPVTYPAYPDTSVALRSLVVAKRELDQVVPLHIEVYIKGLEDLTLENEFEFDFDSKDDVRNFVNKLKELRLSLNPMVNDDDGADDSSDDDSTSDTEVRDILSEIEQLQEKHKL